LCLRDRRSTTWATPQASLTQDFFNLVLFLVDTVIVDNYGIKDDILIHIYNM
jgi:hypothetical protein